jgi:hypothetical protein
MPFQFKILPFEYASDSSAIVWESSSFDNNLTSLLFNEKGDRIHQLLENRIKNGRFRMCYFNYFSFLGTEYAIRYRADNNISRFRVFIKNHSIQFVNRNKYLITDDDMRWITKIIRFMIESAIYLQLSDILKRGREYGKLFYLTKQLQGNPDVLSTISMFLVKGEPRKEWNLLMDKFGDHHLRMKQEPIYQLVD